MRRSIYVKFVLALGAALLLATTLGGFIIAHDRQASAQAQQAARLGGQVARVASMIGAAGYPEDAKGAQRLLSLLLFDRAILCAEIVDRAGARTGVSAPARVGCRGSDVQEMTGAAIPDSNFELRVGISGAEMAEVRNDVIWGVALLGAMAIVYATLAAYIVFRRVVGAPITKILASMQHFTQTGVHRKINYAARDELGDVIEAFNAMQTRLARESAALNDANDMLRRAVHTDALTGLPNRGALAVRAGRYCAGALPAPMAALLIDVDSFKEINDRLGHAAGDDVLRQSAQRLQDAAGRSAFIARLGGDEFVARLDGATGEHDCAALEARIEAAFAKPMVIGGKKLVVRLSVGAALSPSDEMDMDALIARADQRMYEIKRQRRQATAAAPQDDNERAA